MTRIALPTNSTPYTDVSSTYCDEKFASLKLWEMDHDTLSKKLIYHFLFDDEQSMRAINGGWVWEAYTKKFRNTFLNRIRDLGVAPSVVKVKNGTHVLMIGADRRTLSKGIIEMAKEHKLTPEQRSAYLFRLARGEWPNMDDDYEIALEFDLLL